MLFRSPRHPGGIGGLEDRRIGSFRIVFYPCTDPLGMDTMGLKPWSPLRWNLQIALWPAEAHSNPYSRSIRPFARPRSAQTRRCQYYRPNGSPFVCSTLRQSLSSLGTLSSAIECSAAGSYPWTMLLPFPAPPKHLHNYCMCVFCRRSSSVLSIRIECKAAQNLPIHESEGPSLANQHCHICSSTFQRPLTFCQACFSIAIMAELHPSTCVHFWMEFAWRIS